MLICLCIYLLILLSFIIFVGGSPSDSRAAAPESGVPSLPVANVVSAMFA